MINLTNPYYLLIYIVSLFVYMVAAKRIRLMPEIPTGLFVCYFFLKLVQAVLLPYGWGRDWIGYVGTAADVFIAWGVARIIFWIFMKGLSKIKNENDVPPKITQDFALFITFFILMMVVLRVRSDINLAGLLTTSAAITVVIGLAAQATLSNFFSGLIIQAERPFSIGDWIEFDSTEGRVVGISWKSTQLLTRDQVLIYIPNSVLASSPFSNFSRPTRKKIARIYLGLEYGVPYNKVKEVVRSVTDQHPRILRRPRVRVRLVEFGDFAITYEIRMWHENYSNEPQLKADVRQALWYALRRNDIRIPFPIRDVFHGHIERDHQNETMAAQKENARDLMASVPILQPLTTEEISDLSRNIKIQVYGAGEVIFREGDEGDSMYIIQSGSCEALKIKPESAVEKHLSTMEPGNFFGEISLLTGENRTATVKAVEDTSLIVISKDMFSNVIIANPVISEKIADIVMKRKENKGIPLDTSDDISASTTKFMETIKMFFNV